LTTPALCRNSDKWSAYLEQASPELKEEIKNNIIRIDHILGKYL